MAQCRGGRAGGLRQQGGSGRGSRPGAARRPPNVDTSGVPPGRAALSPAELNASPSSRATSPSRWAIAAASAQPGPGMCQRCGATSQGGSPTAIEGSPAPPSACASPPTHPVAHRDATAAATADGRLRSLHEAWVKRIVTDHRSARQAFTRALMQSLDDVARAEGLLPPEQERDAAAAAGPSGAAGQSAAEEDSDAPASPLSDATDGALLAGRRALRTGPQGPQALSRTGLSLPLAEAGAGSDLALPPSLYSSSTSSEVLFLLHLRQIESWRGRQLRHRAAVAEADRAGREAAEAVTRRVARAMAAQERAVLRELARAASAAEATLKERADLKQEVAACRAIAERAADEAKQLRAELAAERARSAAAEAAAAGAMAEAATARSDAQVAREQAEQAAERAAAATAAAAAARARLLSALQARAGLRSQAPSEVSGGTGDREGVAPAASTVGASSRAPAPPTAATRYRMRGSSDVTGSLRPPSPQSESAESGSRPRQPPPPPRPSRP